MKYNWVIAIICFLFCLDSISAQQQSIDKTQKNIIIYKKEGISNLELLDEYFNIHEMRVDQQIMITAKGAMLLSEQDTVFIEIIPPPTSESLLASTDEVINQDYSKQQQIEKKQIKKHKKTSARKKSSIKKRRKKIKQNRIRRKKLRKRAKKRRKILKRRKRGRQSCYSF